MVERRPRGNWTVCDKYWVSWGPANPHPDDRTGFDVLMRSEPGNQESHWHPVWNCHEAHVGPRHHPDYPPLSLEDRDEIINGMCKVASDLDTEVRRLRTVLKELHESAVNSEDARDFIMYAIEELEAETKPEAE